MLNRRVRACRYLLGFALGWALIPLAWAEQLPIRIYRAADKNGYLWFGTNEGPSRFDGGVRASTSHRPFIAHLQSLMRVPIMTELTTNSQTSYEKRLCEIWETAVRPVSAGF